MHAIKKTISVSENLVKESKTIDSNFSAVVEAALIDYLHHHKRQKAIESFGKWQEREKNSVDIVNELRKEDK